MKGHKINIKSKSFLPNPIAVHGIPDFANSALNPNVIGTVDHENWWKEQMEYIKNGYTTGGLRIPGRLYYYLNYIMISTPVRGVHYPEYVDIDLEYFNLVEYVKKKEKGIILLKARRKGASEKGKVIMDYGQRFTPEGYKGGICAGLDKYSVGLFNKVKGINQTLPKELQLHYLKDNDEILVSGYTRMSEVGAINDGSKNTILCRTMFNDPAVFKGEAFEDVIFEEAGEFDHLLAGYNATKPCFMVGTKMVGTPYVYGTGGNIKSGSAGFNEMWSEADAFGLERFEIMGPRMMIGYFAGSVNVAGQVEEDIPNIRKLKKANNSILGIEDTKQAEKVIINTRKELLKGRNKKKYYDYLQDYPLNAKEAFLTFNNNNFDSALLSDQGYAIDSAITPPMIKYKLEWVKNDDGSIKVPFAVEAKVMADDDEDENFVMMRPGYQPVKGFKNLFVSGCDSYDQDKSHTSKSLGGFLILMRDHLLPGKDSMTPVLTIRNRPRFKEMFYENCLKACVYYDLVGNMMFDVRSALIAQYFKEKGCAKYLAVRPKSFESADSQQTHDFGFAPTGHSKPRMISVMQTYIAYNCEKIWSSELISELLNYDIEQKDSDWDLADALGLALVRHVDINKKPVDLTATPKEDPYELTEYRRDGDGHLKPIVSKEKLKDIRDPFLRLIAQGKV